MQLVPVNPNGHVQVYVWEAKLELHVAPFWHGFDKHGLLSVSKFIY